MFYSMSGDAVEDDGYCQTPGDESAIRAREIAVACYCLLFTIGIHATFVPLLTKQGAPAPNGKPWTEEARQSQLRYWAIKDAGGIVFALLYCGFAFLLAAAFFSAAAVRDAKRLFFAIVLAHAKILVVWPIITALLSTGLGYAVIVSHRLHHSYFEANCIHCKQVDNIEVATEEINKMLEAERQAEGPAEKFLDYVESLDQSLQKIGVKFSERSLERTLEAVILERKKSGEISKHGKNTNATPTQGQGKKADSTQKAEEKLENDLEEDVGMDMGLD
eukprot:gnl/MRDRNA2_/MRDRNA2_232262_c0_seq1.p1 gnl/MRDRNA2_/MRDRNA2_232262_c0~~gnl/MRDRNA2_/MRDRNA2_232262_c0_seq1.p1  ORF type:complete len:319 (-),score=69.83 gnl/MRDRNA2_/MRDRNA2_232262_c0_seq1:285-1112(-)